jgi:hypothetical protein
MFPFKVALKTFPGPIPSYKEWFAGNQEIRNFYQEQFTKYFREANTPEGNKDQIKVRVLKIVSVNFFLNKEILNTLLTIRVQQTALRQRIQANINEGIPVGALAVPTQTLIDNYKAAHTSLKNAIRPFIPHLQRVLRYDPPIQFNQMIANWETACEANGCNHLAVEYPEFTRPGGYQKAINAKPLFIQKALQLCAPRAVLYIDGDMTINHYPRIFDADDVDFMARGWHIDPRASWKHKEGIITVDPYTFETSGGIMYFSQSPESQRLLQEWITETARPSQAGKADDRIISLIFNTKRLLAPMKIIQLPIEYLWLSMDYDWSIDDENKDITQIYVEHPECLTSEDTAAGGGASSDRTPKYYSGIETVYPRSERLYESVMFPDAETAEQFRPWLKYVNSVTYNEEHVPDEELNEEQPFYVYPFGTFGPDRTPIRQANIEKLATTPDIAAGLNIVNNTVELNEDTLTLDNINKQLSLDRTIKYIPTTTRDLIRPSFEAFLNDRTKDRIELVFTDAHRGFRDETIFQYIIDLTQPMLIRPTNPLLKLMFLLLRDKAEIPNVLKNSYQFLSRIRCHILKPARMGGGGNGNGRNNSADRNTEEATNFLYGPTVGGRRRVQRKTRRFRKARKLTRKN